MLIIVNFSLNADWFTDNIINPTKKAFNKGAKEIESLAKKGAKAIETGAKTLIKETGKGLDASAKFIKKEIVDPTKSTFQALDKWKLPDGRLRLDQVAYLGAHNAHANLEEGFLYSQQLWSLDKQLKNGVRHLLIDLWKGKEGSGKGKILLCHDDCEKVSRTLRAGNKNHVTFKRYLEQIKDFLTKNPREILSLDLERYVPNDEVLKDIESIPGLYKYVLTPADYDPHKYGEKWPTLDWLIAKGKRLIIFDTGDPSKYGYNIDSYVIRNMYGTHDLNKACQIRSKPKDARLFQLNYFGTVASPLPIHNTPTQLKKVISTCEQNKVISSGQKPNFVALDNVHLGNAMQWVNELNQNASKSLK